MKNLPTVTAAFVGFVLVGCVSRLGFDPVGGGADGESGGGAGDTVAPGDTVALGDTATPPGLASIVCGLVTSPPPICAGLVALLHFDNVPADGETLTHANDYSGHGNHADCVSATCPTWVADGGRFGGGYSFVDPQWLAIPNSPTVSIAGAVTMSAWFYARTLMPSWRMIVTKLEPGITPELANYGIDHNGDRFYTNFADSVGWHNHASPLTYQTDRWYHLVGIIDDINDRIALYVDGNLAMNDSETASMPVDNGPVWIGWTPNDEGVDGFIDEVAISNRALTPVEGAELYPGFQLRW